MTPYLQTYTGQTVHVIYPDPSTIGLEDIAVALSRICRFNGHTKEFYSVAQHSCCCAKLAQEVEPRQPEFALACLLHDAAEAYLCDIPSPVKQFLGGYKSMEDRFIQTIFLKYDIRGYAPNAAFPTFRVDNTLLEYPKNLLGWQSVMEIDQRILFTEKRDVLVHSDRAWDIELAEPAPWTIHPFPHDKALFIFQSHFHNLMAKIEGRQS